MKNILLLTVVLLTGCYQTLDSNDIDLANKFCKSKNSEIWTMKSNIVGGESVMCKNQEFSHTQDIK